LARDVRVIRDATPADANAIAEIYAHHVLTGTASFEISPPSAAATIGKIERILSNAWPFLVCAEDDVVVGYCYATQFRDRPAYMYACENSIYVRADRMGLGIGRALLTALLAAAETSGFRQMIAVIGGGEPSSIALHERLAFQHAGRMSAVGRKAERWLDTIYMQRELGDGSDTAPPREPA
jgi:L-amino acid N-acyltransferase YncA